MFFGLTLNQEFVSFCWAFQFSETFFEVPALMRGSCIFVFFLNIFRKKEHRIHTFQDIAYTMLSKTLDGFQAFR